MAPNPSTTPNHVLRKEIRKPVIPALPLPISDKKWKASSVPTVSQDALHVVSPPTPSILNEPPPGSETVPTASDAKEVILQEQDDAEDAKPVVNPDDSHLRAVNGHDESHLPPDAQFDGGSRTDTTIPQTTDTLQDQVAEASESPGDHIDDIQVFSGTIADHTDEDIIVPNDSLQQESPDAEDNTSHVETVVDGGAQRVRLSEEDTQTSEQDISSMHHSSNTGLTEYSGTYVDSALEAVPDVRSVSQHGNRMPGPESETAPEVLTNGHMAAMSMGDKVSHTINGSGSSQSSFVPPIHLHLSKLAYSRQFYDVIIQLNPPDRSFQSSYHYAHSAFLIRSERVAALIPDFDASVQYRMMSINPARNVNGHAFEAALRFFYTDEVLTPEALIPKGGFPQKEFKVQVLDYAMSYWFSGVGLGLEAVRNRAYEIVKALADCDIAEVLMKEAQHLRMADDAVLSTPDKLEIRSIADTLVQIVSQILVERISVQDFQLDTEAQGTAMWPRFAELDMQRGISNPALSSMVFGSLPAQSGPTERFETATSAILLNMEFTDLANFGMGLVVWHGVDGFKVLQQIVDEREVKRDQVISNRAVQNKERLSNSAAWDTAGWREFVKDGRLERERVGFLIPTRGR